MSDYLIDTNILVRLVLPHDPLNPVATAAVDELKRRGDRVTVAPQNVVEFWSVATRPVDVNGLGMLPDKVASEVDRIEKMFRVLDDVPSAYKRWRGLVGAYAVRGRQVHDARIVGAAVGSRFGGMKPPNVAPQTEDPPRSRSRGGTQVVGNDDIGVENDRDSIFTRRHAALASRRGYRLTMSTASRSR